MTKSMKIEIVSDVSCPWCVIGYQSLSKALEQLGPKIPAQIAWKPFELNPAMPDAGQLLSEHLHEKYGSTRVVLEETRDMLTARGAAVGFQFNFSENGRIYNTFNAHRLLNWACQYDKQTELKLALFKLYFSEGGNPADLDDLIKTAERVGLPTDAARSMLESDQLKEEVRKEQSHYQHMGIHSVPTFIINDKYMITGGQPVDKFVEMLEKIAAEDGSPA